MATDTTTAPPPGGPLTFFSNISNETSDEGPEEVPDRVFKLSELQQYNGNGEGGLIYLAVCGKVFDVTAGSKFYGEGGPYANFAGTDATRGLGTFSLVPRKGKENEPLTEKQYENAARWVKLFKVKYKLLGTLEPSPPAAAETTSASPSTVPGKPAENYVKNTPPSTPTKRRSTTCCII